MQLRTFTLSLFVPCLALTAVVAQNASKFETQQAIHHDVSQPLREIGIVPIKAGPARAHAVKHWPHASVISNHDGAIQTSSNGAFTPTTIQNFDGIGVPNYGVNSAPPDTSGAAGTTQYVQWVNEAFAPLIFSRATASSGVGFVLLIVHPC